jgi:2-polyprenyl-3-methyl-5-hydroxy-6-metoxy-1,4-benzoquinol methylase
MKRGSLNILCCPNCKHSLSLVEKETADNEVLYGVLECKDCGKTFAIVRGVPRMIVNLDGRKELAESWGYEWERVAEGRLETDTYYGQTEEEEIASFCHYLGISPDNLQGKVVLDAGCGYGRLTRALSKFGAEVYGIDIASSIQCTHDYCQSTKNVHILQADIVDLPFQKMTFDYVFCKLTICYVRNHEETFKGLSALVKPSGRLFISVPDKSDLAFVVRLKDFLRITHYIPRGLLLNLCWAFAPVLSLAKRIVRNPMDSVRTNAFFLFNALHPCFMTRHTKEEVTGWFEKEGFAEVTVIKGMPHLIHIRGTRGLLAPDAMPTPCFQGVDEEHELLSDLERVPDSVQA